MTTYDYIIVGAGLTGLTLARLIKDNGGTVLIIERRDHIGGNVFDHLHESGIRVHTYGPHYFRTSDNSIWNFVNRFTPFFSYIPCLKTLVDGKYENWPISASYIQREIGLNWQPSFKGTPANFEEAALRLMPDKIYFKFIKGYNQKQWGVDPVDLSSDLIKRFDVRHDDDPRLMPKHKYQGIPVNGYSSMVKKMAEGIDVIMGVDYLKNRELYVPKLKLIYTGPIDSFYNYCYGKLKYRGQQRVHEFIKGVKFIQPCGQVNNPQVENGPHIRQLEWKHMMQPGTYEHIDGTLITREITYTPDTIEDYEYPFPDKHNRNLYSKYRDLADNESNVLICGRLGEYRYYDMDQAIGRAMHLYKSL